MSSERTCQRPFLNWRPCKSLPSPLIPSLTLGTPLHTRSTLNCSRIRTHIKPSLCASFARLPIPACVHCRCAAGDLPTECCHAHIDGCIVHCQPSRCRCTVPVHRPSGHVAAGAVPITHCCRCGSYHPLLQVRFLSPIAAGAVPITHDNPYIFD